MKKVNFKKRVSQLMAGVFGLALMGGVMLSSQEVDAQLTDSSDNFEVETNGNWKSETEACTYTVTTTFTLEISIGAGSNSATIGGSTSQVEEREGTRRKCVNGSGWCFWGSSCS